MQSALKNAFRQAREEKNIDLILPIFLETKFFAIAKKFSEKGIAFFLKPSPQKERECVTVSEDAAVFKDIADIELIEITGEALLKKIGNKFEIVICYTDGGDYLNLEQIAWYSKLLSPDTPSPSSH